MVIELLRQQQYHHHHQLVLWYYISRMKPFAGRILRL